MICSSRAGGHAHLRVRARHQRNRGTEGTMEVGLQLVQDRLIHLQLRAQADAVHAGVQEVGQRERSDQRNPILEVEDAFGITTRSRDLILRNLDREGHRGRPVRVARSRVRDVQRQRLAGERIQQIGRGLGRDQRDRGHRHDVETAQVVLAADEETVEGRRGRSAVSGHDGAHDTEAPGVLPECVVEVLVRQHRVKQLDVAAKTGNLARQVQFLAAGGLIHAVDRVDGQRRNNAAGSNSVEAVGAADALEAGRVEQNRGRLGQRRNVGVVVAVGQPEERVNFPFTG